MPVAWITALVTDPVQAALATPVAKILVTLVILSINSLHGLLHPSYIWLDNMKGPDHRL